MIMRILASLFGFALGALVVSASLAQGDGEVKITSDRFVVNEGDSQATFTGNVEVMQPNLTVYADKVVVFYGAGGASDLEKMEATGKVRILSPDQKVTGDRGVYDPDTKILHVYGNVVVVNSAGTVTGPELEVNLETRKSEFVTKGGSGRVTGIFSPQEN